MDFDNLLPQHQFINPSLLLNDSNNDAASTEYTPHYDQQLSNLELDDDQIVIEEDKQEEEDEDESANENGQDLHCLCRRPDDGKFMLECDKCNVWYHGRCVSMTRDKARRLSTWLCPQCSPSSVENESDSIVESSSIPKKRGVSIEIPILAKSARQKLSKPASSASLVAVAKGDLVRNRVIEMLSKVLQAAHKAISGETNKTDDLDSPVPHHLDKEQIVLLAKQIESEMFSRLGQSSESIEYKEKFRSLHFNLKDSQNALNVLSGQIPPERLVVMTADEFASENMRLMKQEIHEKSLANSVLTETMAAVILKKTHKGEVEFKPASTEAVHDAMDSVISQPAVIPRIQEEELSPVDLARTGQEDEQHNDHIEILHEENPVTVVKHVVNLDPVDTESVVSPVSAEPFEKLPKITGTLEELLQKARKSIGQATSLPLFSPTSAVMATSDDQSLSPHAEQVETEAEVTLATSIAEADIIKVADENTCWKGSIEMVGVGRFVGALKYLASSGSIKPTDSNCPLWSKCFGDSMEISGRISHESVSTYLDAQIYSESRSISAFVVEIVDEYEGYESLWKYFTARKRYAVVKSSSSRLKDIYLMPIRKDEQLPGFFDGLDGAQSILQERPHDLLFLVTVYANTESTSSSSQSLARAQKEGISTPAAPANVELQVGDALSVLNTLSRQFSPPTTQFFPPAHSPIAVNAAANISMYSGQGFPPIVGAPSVVTPTYPHQWPMQPQYPPHQLQQQQMMMQNPYSMPTQAQPAPQYGQHQFGGGNRRDSRPGQDNRTNRRDSRSHAHGNFNAQNHGRNFKRDY